MERATRPPATRSTNPTSSTRRRRKTPASELRRRIAVEARRRGRDGVSRRAAAKEESPPERAAGSTPVAPNARNVGALASRRSRAKWPAPRRARGRSPRGRSRRRGSRGDARQRRRAHPRGIAGGFGAERRGLKAGARRASARTRRGDADCCSPLQAARSGAHQRQRLGAMHANAQVRRAPRRSSKPRRRSAPPPISARRREADATAESRRR